MIEASRVVTSVPEEILKNPFVGPIGPEETRSDPLEFHRRLPGYVPTRLVDAPVMADRLGVGRLLVKDEGRRLGLPAFKMLGASWATYRALSVRLGGEIGRWNTIDELAEWVAPLRPLALATATDGNHGRAVARMAALLGFEARILVPSGTPPAFVGALGGEGAAVTIVDGDYDDAVRRAALEAGPRCLVISDTSWPGYEEIPLWVIEGYSTIFTEVDEVLAVGGVEPDVVVVPVGVGALGAAAVHWACRPGRGRQAQLWAVEPVTAACVMESIRRGERTSIDHTHDSIMNGLNAGTPSLVAWPLLQRGFDWLVTIEDEWARRAMRDLAETGVVAGATGAAGLGALFAIRELLGSDWTRAMGLGARSTVLVLCTEGATDPTLYQQVVGVPAEQVDTSRAQVVG
ncbi:MAG: diaminopropionate ammonia-lyase [Acidimicrobiia bacterium]